MSRHLPRCIALWRPAPARLHPRHASPYTTRSSTRPNVPFLSTSSHRQPREPSSGRKPRSQIYVFTVTFATTVGIFTCGYLVWQFVRQEIWERYNPTPRDWSLWTRAPMRVAKIVFDKEMKDLYDWPRVWTHARLVLDRLEDPNIDGQGIKEVENGSTYVEDLGKVGMDITEKSEGWRRGYFEALFMAGQAAEHCWGHFVLDKRRQRVCQEKHIIGPTHPNPEPLPPGSGEAPREEDCEPLCDKPAESYYLRILTTRGFTVRQKIQAALAYACFLEYQELPQAAENMYKWALSLAVESAPAKYSPLPLDDRTLLLTDEAGKVPGNVLDVLTAIARFKAATGDTATALPMLISLLRARKSLPPEPKQRVSSSERPLWGLNMFLEPPYPPPPDDGTEPPVRDAKEICEEAGLSSNIGEILFAGNKREEGLSWTREAVDIAEEQLRRIPETGDDEAQSLCKSCLVSALDNWEAMLKLLANEEGSKKETQTAASTFQFWKKEAPDLSSRWAQEERVLEERRRRTTDLVMRSKPETPYATFPTNRV